MHRIVIVLALSACEVVPSPSLGPGNDWPYTVDLGATARAFDDDLPSHYCAPGDGEVVRAGRVVASDLVIGSAGDYARVQLPDGARWVRVDAPVARAEIATLAATDAPSEACTHALVMPFADGDHVVVTTSAFVRAITLSSGRVRELDQLGAMLEGCRMSDERLRLRCALDLSWDQAVFDLDGVEQSGAFVPLWRR